MSAALTTNVDQRLLRTTKFPPEFNVKVDMTKVNIDVLKKWITDELAKLLQNDDDVVTELVFNIIEGSRYPNVKELQIALTGFLDKDAATFCKDLWKLCLSAQDNPQGIPKELLEAKRQELIQNRIEEERAREERKRLEAERERDRDREMVRVRDRERNERGRGRGGRSGRDSDRRPSRRESHSPAPRRLHDDDELYRASARVDSYVPSGGRRRDFAQQRRRRSPSSSRSHSPPPKRSRRQSNLSRSPSPPVKRRRRSSPRRSMSLSRSPPRRSRYVSSSRSRSQERGPMRKKDSYRGNARRRNSRSSSRRRSPSPRRYRRRSPSSDRDSNPRSKRNPRLSSTSRPLPRGVRGRHGSDELMLSRGKDRRRLSRASSSRSESPERSEFQNHSSTAQKSNGDAQNSRARNSSSTAANIDTRANHTDAVEVGEDS